jgi:hypothetical protein
MSGAVVEIPHIKWQSQRTLRLDKGLRDAVADLLRARWPSGTAKHAARAFDLTVDRAREAVAGRASLTTVEQIIKEGGPPVALPIIEAVWGDSLARYFADLRKSHEDHGERLAALGFHAGGADGSHRGRPAGRSGLAADQDHAARRGVGDADAPGAAADLTTSRRRARP